MARPIPLPNTGKLNKDTDPENLKPGDYLDLKGMDFAAGEMPALTTQAGNKFVLDFGSVGLQNQRTQINFNSFPTEVTITLRDKNKNVKATQTITTAGNLAANKAAVEAFINGLPYQNSIEPISPLVPELIFLLGFKFADYSIEVSGCTTVVLQEAISQTGVGNLFPIASRQLGNDIFVWLTTQRDLPRRLNNIANVYSSVNSQIGITISNHGLVDNETVSIGAVGGTSEANGIWTVTVIDANNFYLNNSFFANAYSSGGVCYADIYGFGCWGVIRENVLTDSFSFTRLLQTKELNLNAKKAIYNPEIFLNGNIIQTYFTDGYNVPRVIYYQGAYVTNGCIQAINPDGRYAYGTISEETSLQVNYNDYSVEFLEQDQTGGAIPCGNWRYGVRFLTSSQNATEVSLLTGPIPVYSAAYETDTSIIYGELSSVISPKINRITVNGIAAGTFQFIELIAFQYAGEANTVTTSSYIIRRESLTVDQTSIVLEHNGNERSILLFDPQLANLAQIGIVSAQDLTIIQNRLVLGNVAVSSQIDITDWVATFKYSIKRFPVFGAFGQQTFYEFYSPETAANYAGYPFYEWDRFYVAPVLKNGTILNAFFAFDLRWVSKSDYTTFPSLYQFLETNGTDRRDLSADDFDDYNLGINPREYYQLYLQLRNVDWGYLINGVQARDLFSGLKIFRAENVREVLATGAGILSYQPPSSSFFTEFTFPSDYNLLVPPFRQKRSILAIYSPDLQYGQSDIQENVNGDKLIVFGAYQLNFQDRSRNILTNDSTYSIFNPEFDVAGSVNQMAQYVVNDAKVVEQGSPATIDGVTFSKQPILSVPTGDANKGLVVGLDSDVINPVSTLDTGFYYCAYVRERTDKYGDKNALNVTTFTGATLLVDEETTDVFGGYAFNQQMWFRNRQPVLSGSTGGGAGFNIISQNRVNSNLRLWDDTLVGKPVYPPSLLADSLGYTEWLEFGATDQIEDNPGYEIRNTVQALAVYNPFNQDDGKYRERKYYSELNPNGSKVDFLRIILPLNFQDNPAVQEAITGVINLNNRLFTLQKRGFTLEYFNNRGQLISPDSGQILIGDGAVLDRIGNNLTNFGCSERGSVVIGKSQSGKDVLMWFDSITGEFLRFGDDGVRSVSLRANMRTFFNRYNRWVNEANTPANGYGISGVWDNNNKNYYFTFKAWKPYDAYVSGQTYAQGSGVTFGEIGQGVPQIWIAKVETSQEPSDDSTDWLKINVENPDYYNVFTIAFSEIKDGFTFFPYYLPNIYLPWKGTFFCPVPILDSPDRSKLYLHGKGLPNQFFDVDYSGGIIELVMNWQPNLNKKISAMLINANIKPERVDFFALFRNEQSGEFFNESYLITSDFGTREGYQYSPVKNVLDANGSPDGDTARVEGVWCRIRIQFPAGQQTRLNDCIVRIRESFSNFTK